MKILISGGCIAGLAAAILLHKSGHDLKVIDKGKTFQKLGYGLSLKGFGIEIMKQLGLLVELQGHSLSIDTFNSYESNGKLIRSFPKKKLGEITGGVVPIGRADLHGVLYEAARKNVPIEFDTQIVALAHLLQKELVTFSNGSKEEFDLVIVAEGLRSTSRNILWGETGCTQFDITYVAAIINQEHYFNLSEAYSFRGVGKTISFFPVTKDKIVIQAYFRNLVKTVSPDNYPKEILIETFADFPHQVIQLLASNNLNDYIFCDKIAMIELQKFSQEQVVLLGDAGYCPTFLSGMGASLSLLGAKVLSESLQLLSNVKDALSRYYDIMHPIALHFQKNARSNMVNELPQNKIRAAIFNLIMRNAPLSIIAKKVS